MKYTLVGKVMFSLLLITMILSGCKDPTPKPDPAPGTDEPKVSIAEYLPLREGNKWIYEGIGNEFASYTQEVIYEKDNSYQVMVSSGTVTANRYVVTDESIIHNYREHESYDNTNILDSPPNFDGTLLKLPLEVGNSWISGGNDCEIFSINSTVQVPAGTFTDCVVVKTTYKDSSNSSFQYYQKNVGLVKSEYVMENNEKIESLLKEYTIR
ncbi:MAG: hypothetical protein APF84_06315 [Gracilibacter sp. BRH_c7a]|nr:MAG: hypothetical protein APF84_06315 [Gracilibacter sp. BRH_c7a]